MAEVEFVEHGRWAEVVLNRPRQRNAIDGPLGEGLAAAIRRADEDEAIEAVLLRGADGAFCSGLDLKAFNAEPPPDWMPRFGAIWRAAHTSIYECRKPIVAALERFAINGGAALALPRTYWSPARPRSCTSARSGRAWRRPTTWLGYGCVTARPSPRA